MNLAKTGLLSFLATLVKMLSSLIINKIVALQIGPTGLATIGQFQNFIQISMTVGQGAINNGVVKYTAEYKNDLLKLSKLWSTSIRISLFTGLIVAVALFVKAEWFNKHIFDEQDYSIVFIWFSFTIILYVLNSLLLSILNGLKEIKTYISINIIQSLISLFVTGVAVYKFDILGALIALVTNQSIVLFVSIYFIRKHKIISIPRFYSPLDKNSLLKLSRFSMMALVSIAVVPISQIFIRSYISESSGDVAAGYWQAMTYISNMYLMLVTTSLSIYYLPRLSELKTTLDVRKELVLALKLVFPVLLISSTLIYFTKDIIIWVLFSNDFDGMSGLFFPQVVGDILKVVGWIFGMLLSAKAQTKKHIFTQIIFTALLCFLTVIFVDLYGVKGAIIGYAINYAIFLPYIYFLTREYFKK
ncbi:MAG: O-antigen translocase [Paraglaciecola sp.]